MFVPTSFKNTSPQQIFEFITNNSFGTIVSQGEIYPMATHSIFEILAQDKDTFSLRSHIAKGNPQWKSFLKKPDVLCVFQGPHSYISSSWYGHPEVPTWNYVSVQIQGIVSIIDDEAIILEHLNKLVNKYEAFTKTNISLDKLPNKVVFGQIKGLVAFDIEVKKVEAAYKLSQNRNEQDFANIIHQLKNLHNESSTAIANEMEAIKCPYNSK